MDLFFEQLLVRAATIDELLSGDFEPLPGQKGDTDQASRRLAAWCRSCASGDWSLFASRLARDGLSITDVLTRFATVRRRTVAPRPAWVEDATWIAAALLDAHEGTGLLAWPEGLAPCAFETLFTRLLQEAERRLWADVEGRVSDNLDASAHACLRHALLMALSSLCAPVLYDRFAKARKEEAGPAEKSKARGAGSLYDRFVAGLQAGGLRELFREKPVLLRLIATTTRQWIAASREFVLRLDADLDVIRRDILRTSARSRIAMIEGDLSDPHNGGHSVQIVRFEDGSRVVYKPKDLRLDVAWHALVDRLNKAGAPAELRCARVIARDGYGCAEFIEHTGCADADGAKRFFRRAGAWLALFHCFAGCDMHHENMIAASDHPVPIDLETVLQAAPPGQESSGPDAQAFEAAVEALAGSVMMVGLLPAYSKSPKNEVFAIGGMAPDWTARAKLHWSDINTDAMRPIRIKEPGDTVPNLPNIGGIYAKLGDHVDDLVRGFQDYATFLTHISRNADQGGLFEDFAGLPVRSVVRPTRLYWMLLQRLRDHRTMDDGAAWSAQADFLARLSDWERPSEASWPLRRSERAALLTLNVPYFVSSSDRSEISDTAGLTVGTGVASGLDRARARLRSFDEKEIAWQVAVIRENTSSLPRSKGSGSREGERRRLLAPPAEAAPTQAAFLAEAGKVAGDIARYAIRRGPGAAWIGFDWLGESEAAQLTPVGLDFYNGVSGIAVFLAAHAAIAGDASSRELALAAVSHLRASLKSRNAARISRSIGVGGGSGLGSIVYALTVMSKCLDDRGLLADAQTAAGLFSDDLIAADKNLDIMSGSAGGILGLLRLYRDCRVHEVLERAIKCGEHIIAQPRHGTVGSRSWTARGLGQLSLNGMAHGAAGYAYALASLAAATGREDFAAAASECVAFEDASYAAEEANWPDFRPHRMAEFSSRWCHGAPGIGLSRIGMSRSRHAKPGPRLDSNILATDIRNAVAGAERGWPGEVDTMCCGSLGNIEFFCEAGGLLGRKDLCDIAARRLMTVLESARSRGDYRWHTGSRQFNLGLFRGLSGVGYTCLRQADPSLPNVLIWE
jgi:type 2 lantibiotic biosynthesis protein LanM